MVSEAKSVIEELRYELQSWLDNLPENLQAGSKAEELESAIDELETVLNGLEEAESASPEFPGMIG